MHGPSLLSIPGQQAACRSGDGSQPPPVPFGAGSQPARGGCSSPTCGCFFPVLAPWALSPTHLCCCSRPAGAGHRLPLRQRAAGGLGRCPVPLLPAITPGSHLLHRADGHQETLRGVQPRHCGPSAQVKRPRPFLHPKTQGVSAMCVLWLSQSCVAAQLFPCLTILLQSIAVSLGMVSQSPRPPAAGCMGALQNFSWFSKGSFRLCGSELRHGQEVSKQLQLKHCPGTETPLLPGPLVTAVG